MRISDWSSDVCSSDLIIIDFRYNGGGLVSTANLMGDLLGAGRAGQIFSQTRFRPSKSAAEDDEHRFAPGAQSIAPTRIAFIGTGTTASASELVINSMLPYRSEEHTLNSSHSCASRLPSSA